MSEGCALGIENKANIKNLYQKVDEHKQDWKEDIRELKDTIKDMATTAKEMANTNKRIGITVFIALVAILVDIIFRLWV